METDQVYNMDEGGVGNELGCMDTNISNCSNHIQGSDQVSLQMEPNSTDCGSTNAWRNSIASQQPSAEINPSVAEADQNTTAYGTESHDKKIAEASRIPEDSASPGSSYFPGVNSASRSDILNGSGENWNVVAGQSRSDRTALLNFHRSEWLRYMSTEIFGNTYPNFYRQWGLLSLCRQLQSQHNPYSTQPQLQVSTEPVEDENQRRKMAEFEEHLKMYPILIRQQISETEPKNLPFCDERLLVSNHLHVVQKLQQWPKFDWHGMKETANTILESQYQKIREENAANMKAFNDAVEDIKSKMNIIFTKVEAYLHGQILVVPTNYSFPFPQIQQFSLELASCFQHNWIEHLSKIIQDMFYDYYNSVKLLQEVLETYEAKILNELESKGCLSQAEFDQLQDRSKLYAETSHTFQLPAREMLMEAYKKSLKLIAKKLSSSNGDIYRREERKAEEISNAAFAAYKKLMDQKIQYALMTDKCIEDHHLFYVSIVVQAFADIQKNEKCQVSRNPPLWVAQQSLLERNLSSQLGSYKKANRENLKKLAKQHKGMLQKHGNGYRKMMSGLMQTQTTIPLSQNNMKIRHREFLKNSLKDLDAFTAPFHPDLRKRWRDDLRAHFDGLQKKYVGENKADEDLPNSMTDQVEPQLSSVLPDVPKKTSITAISIYLGAKDSLIVGFYMDSKSTEKATYPTLIAFNKETIVCGIKARSHPRHLNLISILKDGSKSGPISFWYYGAHYSLKTEEIFAIYFHWLRLTLERKLQQKVQSCVVSISGMLTCRAKQLLKTSLDVAGFKNNLLLPKTTAMALSYVMQTEVEESSVSSSLLIIYQSGDTLEAARAEVTKEQVQITRIWGTEIPSLSALKKSYFGCRKIFFKEDDLFMKVNNLLSYVVGDVAVHNAAIILDGTSGQGKKIAGAVQQKLKEFSTRETTLSEDSVIFFCASLDALRNKHPDFEDKEAEFPKYTNVSPYTISIKINSEIPEIIIRQNETLFDDCTLRYLVDCKWFGSWTVLENDILHGKERIKEKSYFSFSPGRLHVPSVYVNVCINSEGCCTFQLNPVTAETSMPLDVTSSWKYMIPAFMKDSSGTIQDILTKMRQEGFPMSGKKKTGEEGSERRITKPQQEGKSGESNMQSLSLSADNVGPASTRQDLPQDHSDGGNIQSWPTAPVKTDPAAEIKQNLVQLVEEVRLKIKRDNNSTNPLIIQKISETIRQCEELLGKTEVKVKPLEIKFQVLGAFATKLAASP